MQNKKLIIFAGLLAVIAFIAANSLFIVREGEQALVLQFGEPRQVYSDPGLKLKIPFVQTVSFMEKRVLALDPPAEQVILSDQRRLDVDTFIRFRITDPLLFYQTVRTETVGRERLTRTTNAALRRVLGNATQLEILSNERAGIMQEIRQQVDTQAANFGMEVVDVRIGRADLPEDTEQSVFDRMRSEREREAAEFRAQGEEQAQQIRSRAERERTVILAEAEREAQILRGQGDEASIRILAEAYTADEAFFGFYRTLEAYRTSLNTDDTTLVLSPDGDFFRFFQNLDGGGTPLPARIMESIEGSGANGDETQPPAPDESEETQEPENEDADAQSSVFDRDVNSADEAALAARP
ncbi:protease modulator HflC [Fodinicurvata sp. EGI_FJ10296]|uniref:protease modulator HflC n=1 Tax=Fodinicurvata sp. EGI_FJ10296 TaxID=3231908 RepID=UPI003455CE41